MKRLKLDFYSQDAVTLAQQLLGKTLVRVFDDGSVRQYKITATEAYCGAEDKACHASKGRTPRTEVMFHSGGKLYVYLIYGIYWLLNVVSGMEDNPEAVLICGLNEIRGSGRVGRELKIDKSFYGEDLQTSKRIWIEDGEELSDIMAKPRVGVDYAEEWKDKLWRFEI
ncbi:MAG TPA: DNA-3-methyladenine glycosylase [Bacteroidales bacterium]|nr:DNA-3-methyladenine glycosylase [Bacteroidales bacterium]